MKNKEFSNTAFMKTNSYEEFQSLFIKYFESYNCFSFHNNLLQFIAEKEYFHIFEFLFKNGLLFDSQDKKTLSSFYYKYHSNTYSQYFKYDTLSYITNYGYSVSPKHYPRKFEKHEQWLEKDILLQKYITFQTIKNSFFADEFEDFLVEKIKHSDALLNSINYFIQLNNEYNLRFIKKLLDNNLLTLDIESKIFIFKKEEYFTSVIKDIIDNPENFNFVISGLKQICTYHKEIPIHIFNYIMQNSNLNLALKLNQIAFSFGSLVLESKEYSYNSETDTEESYYTYDYSIVLNYLQSILNSKYLPELVSKRYFIFNKEFVNHTINQEQIQSLFDDHFELLMQHSHNFSDKLDHLQEKFKLALMINIF